MHVPYSLQITFILISFLTLILSFGDVAELHEMGHRSSITKSTKHRDRHSLSSLWEWPLFLSEAKFVHDALDLGQISGHKQKGLVTKSKIFKGEIVLVENPLVLFGTKTPNMNTERLRVQFQNAVREKSKRDIAFSKMWASMSTVKGFECLLEIKPHRSNAKDLRKWFGVFRLFREIDGTGLVYSDGGPTPNVAVVFGERKDHFTCVVIATTDIPKGSKLMIPGNRSWKTIVTGEDYINSEEIFKVLFDIRGVAASDWAYHLMQKTACLRTVKGLKPRRWCNWDTSRE